MNNFILYNRLQINSRSGSGFVLSHSQSPGWTHVNAESAFGTKVILDDQEHREKLDGCWRADRYASSAFAAPSLVNKNFL